MKLGIFYTVCGSVGVLLVIGLAILLAIGVEGEQSYIIGRIIITSILSIGALSSGLSKVRIAKMKEEHND